MLFYAVAFRHLSVYPGLGARQQGLYLLFSTPIEISRKTVFQGRKRSAVIESLLHISGWDIAR